MSLVPVSLRGDEVVVEIDNEHAAADETLLRREEVTHVPGARGDIGAVIKNLPGVANTQGFGPQAGLVIRWQLARRLADLRRLDVARGSAR